MKINSILALLFVFILQISFAQNKNITGVVSDETGPLPGVSVLIKGAKKGVVTNFSGEYAIKAKLGDILIFSFVGMKNVEKTIGGGSKKIDVLMVSDNVLDEVVVVGYGKTTKRTYTGTAKSVNVENIDAKSVSNISEALSGEVAGVNVITATGQPGSSSKIRIRGFGSINGNRDPLYVVDGVPFFNSINSINPSDIKSTTVLKDAASTAIYGSRGANGVILITTKNGNSNKSSIDVDFRTGVNFLNLPRYSVIESPEEYAQLSWSAMRNNGELLNVKGSFNDYASKNVFSDLGISKKYNIWNLEGKDLFNKEGKIKSKALRKYTPERWIDYVFQPSFRKQADIKFSGGSEKVKYFSSFGYLDDIGYSVNSRFSRYSTRLNLEYKPISWLTAKSNLYYASSKQKNNGQSNDSGNVFLYVNNMPPLFPVFDRDDKGNKIPSIIGQYEYDFGRGRQFSGGENSLANAVIDSKGYKYTSINGNFSFNFMLTNNLFFDLRYGINDESGIYHSYINPFYGSYKEQGGYLYKDFNYYINQNFLKMLIYKVRFGEHNLKILAAHENNSYESKTNNFTVMRIVNLENGKEDPQNFVNTTGLPSGTAVESRLESYFTQLNYNYFNKYYLSASIRRDGSSRFFKNKWGTFGSLGLGWIVSKENFLVNSKWLNFLKLKSSYGLVGDQGSSYYLGQGGYNIGVDSNEKIALTLRKIANKELTWEISKMFQVGTEFELFNNSIEGVVDFYTKKTSNLFFQKRLAPSTGNALITVNDGELLNTGIEFDFTGHIIRKNNFKLSLSVNGEMISNKLLKMPFDPSINKRKVLDIANYEFGRSEGHSIFDFYMRDWAGVDPNDGLGMWYLNYDDKNNNGIIDSGEQIKNLTQYLSENPKSKNSIKETTTKKYQEATQRYINKSVIPKLRGAFRLNTQFERFSFTAQFAYSLGGFAYDYQYANLMHNNQIGSNNWHTDIKKSWKKKGDKTNVPRFLSNYSNSKTGVYSSNFNSKSSRFLTSTDYIALNNAKVAYNIPGELLSNRGISSVKIWVSGNNLFLFSKRDGFNPSTDEEGSSSSYRYAPVSTITLGANIKF